MTFPNNDFVTKKEFETSNLTITKDLSFLRLEMNHRFDKLEGRVENLEDGQHQIIIRMEAMEDRVDKALSGTDMQIQALDQKVVKLDKKIDDKFDLIINHITNLKN